MNVNERDRRPETAVREAGQRMPRSGGRTTEQRAPRATETVGAARSGIRRGGTPAASDGVRGARHYPTEGTAAVQLDAVLPVREKPAASPSLRVAPPPPVLAPRAPFVALILIVVVAGVLGILMINVKTNENAFRLAELQEQEVALDRDQQRLEEQIAFFESPGNLDAAARKLGLVKAGPPAFIRLPDGKIIGVPKPADGQPAITSQQGTGATAGQPASGG